ncbi:MAG: response regulator [Candidatus Omnitrophica bacterium]|nr:response regulator [Candidatus Omnitrophota bacterium]
MQKSPTVLIIEDDVETIMLMKERLEREGFVCFCALEGKEGLELAKQKQPNLILLDWSLPDIDGLKVYAKLRFEETTKAIPVIFVTGRTQMQDIEKALSLGINDYICKPFMFEELLKKIKRFL